jgi:hypothetical protein
MQAHRRAHDNNHATKNCWGVEQNNLLLQLAKAGEIDPRNNDPTYCFDVTLAFSSDFVGECRTGCATAVQRLQRKFRCIQINCELLGRRGE